MEPTISVIIPTYNRAELVQRAVASVMAQTRPVHELIVVDDGSSDGSERLLADRDGVRYVYQANRGVSAARNRGVAAATGDWVAFLDSDDEWLPQKLERQVQALASEPGCRICHCDEIWIRNGRRVNPKQRHAKSGGYIFEQCLPLCAISPSAVMIERALLLAIGGFDESLPACEDYDLWLRLCAQHPVLFVDEPLVVKYGGHADQLSRAFWGMDRFRIVALEKIVASGVLSASDRDKALHTLIAKIGVYMAGAHKRGRSLEVADYESRLQHYKAQERELWQNNTG